MQAKAGRCKVVISLCLARSVWFSGLAMSSSFPSEGRMG